MVWSEMQSKISTILIVAFAMAWPGSPTASGRPILQEVSDPAQAVKPLLIGTAKTRKEILAHFVNAISRQEYDGALSLLHPKMSEAWTREGFARDWNSIRRQLSGDWNPELTGTFTGQSPQGPYEQVSYRLVSDWRSIASVDLTAMLIGGEPKIVQIHARVPVNGTPSKEANARIEGFVEAMLREDYSAVQAMFAPERRQQYPPDMLARIRPILGNSQKSTSLLHYRLNANIVWYDAVRLSSPNDPATFLDVIMEAGPNGGQIVSLSFKGRLRQ